MTVLNENPKAIQLEFSAIEMHIVNKAMSLYNQKSFELTDNANHAEATENLYGELCEAWFNMPASYYPVS